jgi:hypothetical protein
VAAMDLYIFMYLAIWANSPGVLSFKNRRDDSVKWSTRVLRAYGQI